MSKHLIHNKEEIISLLQDIQNKHNAVTLLEPKSPVMTISEVLEVTTNTVVFAANNPQDASVRKLIGSLDMVCMTHHEHINIQWPVDHLSIGESHQRPALVAPLPDELLRLQRRENYRLITPDHHPLRCQIPIIDGEGNPSHLDAQVIDIGAGGLAVMAPPDHMHWEPGMKFPSCRIELPGVGVVMTTLQVCNVFVINKPDGSKQRRSGCQFAKLSPQASNLISRYMIGIEQEKNVGHYR